MVFEYKTEKTYKHFTKYYSKMSELQTTFLHTSSTEQIFMNPNTYYIRTKIWNKKTKKKKKKKKKIKA